MKLNNPTLIASFPGHGLVGSISGSGLDVINVASSLNGPKVVIIEKDSMTGTCRKRRYTIMKLL